MLQELAGGPPIEIFSAERCSDLRWSGDSSQLLLDALTSDDRSGIYIVPRLGGASRRIDWAVSACWAPDSSEIAISRGFKSPIHFVNISTGEERSVLVGEDDYWMAEVDWSAAN